MPSRSACSPRCLLRPTKEQAGRGPVKTMTLRLCLSLIGPCRDGSGRASLNHLLRPGCLYEVKQTSTNLAQPHLQGALLGGTIASREPALHLAEEVTPTPFRMGQHQREDQLPLPLKRIAARAWP